MKTKISVIIPAYNEGKFLSASLMSLKKQKIKENYEIIVVDNNSTDNTAKIARKYGARVVKEAQKGVCFARQCGSTNAKSDIIVSTDADCTFPKDWLNNIYQEFIKKPETIAVIGPFEYEKKPLWGRIYSTIVFKLVHYFYLKKNKIIYVAASNLAFRKNTLTKIGGYNTALAQGGDEHDLLLKFRKLGQLTYLPQNKILTSSRRLNKGLVYNLFVSLIGYYVLDYAVANKLTGKTTLGQWPAYRETKPPKRNWLLSSIYTVFLFFMFFSLVLGTGKIYAKSRYISGGKKVFSASKDTFSDAKEIGYHHHHLIRTK